MIFSIEAKSLNETLSTLTKVIERRNTIPILSNLRLDAMDDIVRITATDLDMEMKIPVAAKVEEKGSTTVPGHLLADIVRKLPAGAEIKLALKDKQSITVQANRSRFELQTLPPDDFPELTSGQYTHFFAMTGNDLAEALSRVQFAVSTEETRYYLNGVYVHVLDVAGVTKLRAVATDGHRLARYETDSPAGAAGMPSIIIPRKTVKELIDLAKAAGAKEVNLSISENKILARSERADLISKLIDGTFPDYERVIPAQSNNLARVDGKALAGASDRVNTISSERGRAVLLSLSRGHLVLTANNPDAGAAEESMDVNYDADDLEIGFNSKYLADVIASLKPGETTMSLTDAGSPTRFSNEADPKLLIVLMPMRV